MQPVEFDITDIRRTIPIFTDELFEKMLYVYRMYPENELLTFLGPVDPYDSFYRRYHASIRRWLKFGGDLPIFNQRYRVPTVVGTGYENGMLLKLRNTPARKFIPNFLKNKLNRRHFNLNNNLVFAASSFISSNALLQYFDIHLYKNSFFGFLPITAHDDNDWGMSANPFFTPRNHDILENIMTHMVRVSYTHGFIMPLRDVSIISVTMELWSLPDDRRSNDSIVLTQRILSLGPMNEPMIRSASRVVMQRFAIAYERLYSDEIMTSDLEEYEDGNIHIKFETMDSRLIRRDKGKIIKESDDVIFNEYFKGSKFPLFIKKIRFAFNYTEDIRRMRYYQNIFYRFVPEPALGGCFGFDSLTAGLVKRLQPYIVTNSDPTDIDTNNCFFKEFLTHTGMDYTPEDLRTIFNIHNNNPIHFATAIRIMEHFGVPYQLLHREPKESRLIVYENLRYENIDIFRVLLMGSHYYTITSVDAFNKLLKLRYCRICYNYYFIDNEKSIKHQDGTCGSRKRKAVDIGEKYVGGILQYYDKKKRKEPKVYFADFETVTIDGVLHVYAACIMDEDELQEIFYGEDAIEEFTKYIVELEGILYFYNGSSFDNHFIIEEAKEKMYPLNNLMYRGSKLLSFEIGMMTVRDLCLFTLCKLKSACAAFGVKGDDSKGKFDHTKINSFFDAMIHQDEVMEYIVKDVRALRKIYKKFRKSFMEINDIDINDCITLSHASFSAWMKQANIKMDIPGPYIDGMCRLGYYGGRVFPQRLGYLSPDAGKKFSDIVEYRIDIDFVSLYPSAMKFFTYFYNDPVLVSSPKRCDKLMKEIEDEIDKYLKGKAEYDIYKPYSYIVCCDVETNKNLITPLLPEKTSKGVFYNLKDKVNQVYVLSELMFALFNGYKLLKIHWFISFSKTKKIFEAFIDKNMAVKNAHRKGEPQYVIAKSTQNSTYGKFAQQRIITETAIVHTEEDLESYDLLLNFKPFVRKTGSYGFIVETLNKNRNPTKPVYIAAQVTAYARILTNYALMKGGSLVNPASAFDYTDTDSFVIDIDVAKRLNQFGMIGENLGQLDDELKGGKIVRAIYLAPKTYILEYVMPDDRVYWKIRCKGIPHTKKPIKAYSPNKGHRDYSLSHEEFTKRVMSAKLRKKIYELKKGDETVMYTSCLTFDVYKYLMDPDYYVQAYFGSFKRSLNLSFRDMNEENRSGIDRKELTRTINNIQWWENNNFRTKVTDFNELSYPVK